MRLLLVRLRRLAAGAPVTFLRGWLTGAAVLVAFGAVGTHERWPIWACVLWLGISAVWACIGFAGMTR